MATQARFPKAADNTRPRKAHRYDLIGLKIDRPLFLFGRAPLEAWIALEAEPAVISYCERPLVVPNSSPKRLVDFWVRFADREELWLLQRDIDRDGGSDLVQLLHSLTLWCSAHGMVLRSIPPVRDEKSVYLDNWGRIIRDLSANKRFVSRALCERLRERLTVPNSLGELEAVFSGEDPVLVRTAAFSLLHAGYARCTDIDLQPIGMSSMLEAK